MKAFYKCYYIENISIPESVKSIEEKAFHRTSALTELTLSNNLEFIGKDAFAYCDKLEIVTIPKSVLLFLVLIHFLPRNSNRFFVLTPKLTQRNFVIKKVQSFLLCPKKIPTHSL